MKTGSSSDTNYMILSQSPHGKNQGGQAIDIAHLKGNALANGKVTYIKPQKDSRYSYFGFGADNWDAQLVHAKPLVPVGSSVSRGKPLWQSTWHHLHFAIKVNGVFKNPLSCLDWNLVTVYWLKKGQYHPIWTKKGTYEDIDLQPYPAKILEMVTLQKELQCKITSTVNLRVRDVPSTNGKVIGEVTPGTLFKTKQVANGSAVEGVTTWYKYSNGWVSGKYIAEISATTTEEIDKLVALNTKLNEKNKELSENNAVLVTENQNLKVENQSIKPVYEAIKLVNNIK